MQYQNQNQYQYQNQNSKRRSKHDIFPEKYHLELQKTTSNFKSEWTNTINELNFNEVYLTFPETNNTKTEEKFKSNNNNDYFKPLFSEFKAKIINSNIPIPNPTPIPPRKIEIQNIKKIENQIIKIHEQKSAVIYSKFITRPITNNIIPKNVFMCWSTLELPPKMLEVIEFNKKVNPEFTFHIYDDIMCREFIINHFEKDVVYAFDKLIPGAYKADLWRLCVLFVNGGIYLDIKFKCINGFTFLDVIDNEYLTLDIPSSNWTNKMYGIYNGFMVCKRNNPFLWKCIRKIVQNVMNLEYGKSCLFPTGPGLLGDIYFENIVDETDFINKLTFDFNCVFSNNIKNIIFQNTAILEIYPEYRNEQQKESKLYYSVLWNKHRIYDLNITYKEENNIIDGKNIDEKKSVIPLKIYQTWYTKQLPELLQNNINILKEQNPEFKFFLFDDNDCRDFIQCHFDISVLDAFDKLIPGAYKADLFRYCILYIQGGIYLDIKYYGINGFKFITLIDKEYLVQDLLTSGEGIYNALMICKAGNQLLWKAIQNIVENVSTLFYGISTLEPTGPLLLKKIIMNNNNNDDTCTKIELFHKEIYLNLENKIGFFIYNNSNIPILTFSEKYRELQHELFKNIGSKPYYVLWENKQIYKLENS